MKQTILITGGTGKFGRKFVEHFLNKGWIVLFTSTNESRIESLISEFSNAPLLMGFCCDLTSSDAAKWLVDEINLAGFHVNHLVNNARSLSFLQTDEKNQTDRDDFLGEYLLDVVVPYELSTALFNRQPDELKTVTNIGSQYGLVAANPNLYERDQNTSPIQYGTAKAALQHLTKELAVRFSYKKVRVNCIAYGGVEGRTDDNFKARYAKLTPTGKMLSEEELVGPLEQLIQDSCSAITGHTLVADGGWSIW